MTRLDVAEVPVRTGSLPPDARSAATERALATAPSGDDDGDGDGAEAALRRLAAIVGYHPLRTLYGRDVWSTSSRSSFHDGGGGSTADSAYGATALPLHTDMTYLAAPPGAQVFLMVQPAEEAARAGAAGAADLAPRGQSVYVRRGRGRVAVRCCH